MSLVWFTLNVTVVVTVKLFCACPNPGFAHLGGGGGGVLTFCPIAWLSSMMFLISGRSTGEFAQDRLLNADDVDADVDAENLVLHSSTTVDFDVSAILFVSKVTLVS